MMQYSKDLAPSSAQKNREGDQVILAIEKKLKETEEALLRIDRELEEEEASKLVCDVVAKNVKLIAVYCFY